jgi:hypothetical protein
MKIFTPNRFLVRNFIFNLSLVFVLLLSVGKGWGQNGPFQIYEGCGSAALPTQGGTWSANSIIFNTSSISRSGLYGLTFDASADNIRTPLISSPGVFSFWYKRSGTSGGSPQFTIETSTDNSTWTSRGTVSTFTTSYQFYSIDLGALNLTNVYVRIKDTRASGTAARYVDDIAWTSTNPSSNTILIQWVSGSVNILNGLTYTLYDIGGVNDEYNLNQSSAPLVILPPVGYLVSTNITSIGVESGYDYLKLYNGNSIATTALHSGSGFSGSTAPGTFTSTHSTGALTFDMTSDGVTNGFGFIATLTTVAGPTCYFPASLSISTITPQTTTITWSAPSTGTAPANYIYEVRTSGAAGSGSIGLVSSGTIAAPNLSASLSNLTANTSYSFYLKSDCGNGDYSLWSSAFSFTTLKIEPTNQITSLAAGTVTTTDIPLTWIAAVTGSQAPDGYLVKASSIDLNSITNPTDGTDPANVTAFTSNSANKKQTTGTATSTSTFTGTAPGTMYYYKVYSYTNSGTGIDFKTDNPATLSYATKPNAVSSTLSSETITSSAIGFSWSAVTGYLSASNDYLIFAKAGSSITLGTPSQDPALYSASSTFGNGTAYQGDASAFCVYKGDGTSISLSGLNSATTYYFLIYTVVSNANSNGSFSYSTGTSVNRTTLCSSISVFPFLENFEGITTGVPNCWGLAGTLAGSSSYHFGSYSTGQNGRGMRFDSFYSTSGSTSELISPTLNLSSLNTAELNFYFKNPTGGNFEVLISNDNGVTYTSLQSNLTGQTTWLQKTYNISSYISSTVKIKFKGTSNYGSGDAYIYLDEVSIQAISTCYPTISIASSAITYQSATISWTAPTLGTSPQGYQYEIRTSGAAGSGSTGLVSSGSISSPNISVNITGLNGTTLYYFYVRSSCGSGDFSSWSNGSFSTPCGPISVFPSTENFTTYLPSSCWVEATNGNQASGPSNIPASSAWAEDGYLNNGSTGAVKINIDASSDNEWIITPCYSLPMSDYRVKFDVGATQWNYTYAPATAWESDDFVQLLVNVNGSTSWIILKTYNNTNVPSYLGQTDMFSLSSYAGQTVQFAFRAKEGNQDGSADIDFFIDNFTVEATPISTWTGTTNANWATASNWSNSTLPAETNVIIIPSNVPNFPDASSITIGSTGSLSLQSNAQLTISGTLTNNGTLTLESGATLVQGSSSTLAGSGTYNVKQAITGDGTTTPSGRFWYLGSPVSLASSSVYFASNAANVVKKRSESTNAWTALSSGTPESLVVGQGYYTQAIPANSTINFTGGLLNNGAISITNLTRTAGQGFEGFNLVSNPYPSYLDWDAVTKTDIGNTMWYRTHNGTAMVFDTYVAGTGGIGTNLNGNGVSNLIPPMQSFWVRVNSGSSTGSLAVNNTMRSHFTSINGSVAGLKSTANERDLFLRMNLLQANKKDQLIVYVNEQATNGFDILDGEKMMQAGFPQFYTKAGDKKIVINGLNSAKKQQALPVTIELPTTGVHSFVIEDLEISNGLVWLEDKQEEIIQALEPGTVYEFYAASGLNAERFVLHFQLIDDAVPTNVYNEVNSSANFSGKGASVYAESAGVVVIKLPASAEGVTDIQIRDAAGKLVYAGSMNNLEASVELAQANGIYYVTLSSNTGVEVRKVFIQQ